MECRTKRLIIRDFVADDRDSVRTWRSDPDVVRYLDKPLGDEPDRWFDTVLQFSRQARRTAHDAAIVLRSTGEVIGWIGMGRSIDPGGGDLVVGYALARRWWGNGYMTEALVAVLDYGFTHLGAGSISAQCYAANAASARVMEKAGMRAAGRAPSANPALGESLRYIAARDEWRRPARRRFGLLLVALLVAVVAVPAGLGQLLDRPERPAAPDDPRLLAWTPRGDLAGDRDFVAEAADVWRGHHAELSGTELGEVHPVWAGTIGSGRLAILQSVGDDGTPRIAQVAEHGDPATLRLDSQDVIRTRRPDALVVNYDGNVDIPMLRPGRGSAVLRLLLPPDARNLTVFRRVRDAPAAGEVNWERLSHTSSGLTATWLHLDSRSPGGTVVVMARSVDSAADSVSTVAAVPGHVVAQRPAAALVDPTWGPMLPLDLAAYDDAMVAGGVEGVPPGPPTPPMDGDRTTVARLASAATLDARLSVLELQRGGQTSAVLVAWFGGRLACTASRTYPDLSSRILVQLGCTDPESRDVALAIVTRPGVDRVDIYPKGTSRTWSSGGVPPVLRRLRAGELPDRQLMVSVRHADGVHSATEPLVINESTSRRR
jgi:RimJ/RimL family protein N-acetyltransferase